MKKYYPLTQICSLLLLIFITPCYGQRDGNIMFHGAIRDKAGNLWFATTGADAGVYRYNAATGGFTNFTERDGLCDNNVGSIIEDKAGNLWFSSENGVCRYDGKSFTRFTMNEMCPFDIGLLLEERNGNFWFGSNGYGICRYNPATGAITHFTKEDGLGSNTVQCMLEDKAGNLWVGERAGGVCRYDTVSGKFIKVNGDGCFSSQIMSIIEDKTGNIWFVNLYDGLCRFDPSASLRAGGKSLPTGQAGFTHFTVENGLCSDTITCIYEDKKGNLWFGSDAGKSSTGRAGLCRYNPTSGVSTHFTEKDGITKSNVWTIVEDNDGNIWVCTKGGLYRYHALSGRFINMF